MPQSLLDGIRIHVHGILVAVAAVMDERFIHPWSPVHDFGVVFILAVVVPAKGQSQGLALGLKIRKLPVAGLIVAET
jgi:hypothetical protein